MSLIEELAALRSERFSWWTRYAITSLAAWLIIILWIIHSYSSNYSLLGILGTQYPSES